MNNPIKFILMIFLLLTLSCSKGGQPPESSPKGTSFPTVEGTSLSGDKIKFPEKVSGTAAIIVVGYLQDAQFDIDRWIYGLLEHDISVPVYELPTISGLIPRIISERINSGMRSGIPEEDWDNVVTIYEDADKIKKIIGTENPKNAHIVLLDSEGIIAWTHNRGYSPRLVLKLKSKLSSMQQ